MKIAVFSDIHSNYLTFKKGYDDSLKKKVYMHLFLGDYITDGFDGNKVLDIVRSSKGHAINGNREISVIGYSEKGNEKWERCHQYRNMKYGHDLLSEENMSYIKSLSIYKLIEIEGKKILMMHGSPSDVNEMIWNDDFDVFDKFIEEFDADIYLMGHMHLYFDVEYKGRLFINAGSIGSPVYVTPFSYIILNIEKGNISFEKIDIETPYEEVEKYYNQGDYCEKVPIWSKIVLRMIKTARPTPDEFIGLIIDNAKKQNIDISNGFPNDFFEKCFIKYEKEHIDDYKND